MRIFSDILRLLRIAALVGLDLVKPSRPEFRLRAPVRPGR